MEDVMIDRGEDQLLDVIGRYRAELASWGTQADDMTDEWLDASMKRADSILDEVESVTAIGAAGALAALDLLKTIDLSTCDCAIHGEGIDGEYFPSLIDAVRRYIVASANQL